MNKIKKKLNLSIDIKASRAKVWETLLGQETYKDWCSAFYEGSYYEGAWAVGETVKFLGPNPDGTVDGLVVKIVDYVPGELCRSECIGIVEKSEVITEHPEGIQFLGSIEEYVLTGTGDISTLTINQDVPESFYGMFSEMWPKALTRLKEIAEAAPKG